jgi:hypothetical protein
VNTQAWIWFSIAGWGLPFTLYVCAQIASLFVLRRRFLKLALIPIPIMAAVLVVTYSGYMLKSNLWPIWLIVTSPVALLYLVALWILATVTRKPAK